MITKTIDIEGIAYDTYEVQVLLADGSLRGELLNSDGSEGREHSVVFVEPFPFELTEDELLTLNT